uniref:C-type lectin n=1 Tax=Acrobeloides nanus TaxID=290746 RepID=A0A914DBL2_9BILA
MQRQLVLIALLASVTFSFVVKSQDSKPGSFYTPSDNAQCSTNASSAYFDVILVIDTSVNMGASNLRKISTTLSLSLSKFPIGNQIDIAQGQRNVRIAVVTFDNQATIVANYSDINSVNDLTRILNGVTASNMQGGNLAEGLNKAFYIQTNCTDVLTNGCAEGFYYMRPTAMLIFAAYVDPSGVQNVTELVNIADFFDDGTPITVNFNTANQGLTNMLNMITFNPYVNASMYNFMGSSGTLTRDLEWAMLQANCYCGDDWGTNTYHFNTTLNRWQKNAECMILSMSDSAVTTNVTQLCADVDHPEIPGYVLTKERETWLENNLFDFPGESRGKRDVKDLGGNYPFYLGLHKNNNSQWTWWNYDLTEFPATYLNWAPGHPQAGDNCAIADSNDGQHLVWKSYGCDPSMTGLGFSLCQGPACDATTTICCADCYYCEINPNCGIFPKKKAFKKRSKKDRLIRKMAKVNGRMVRVA